MIKNFLFDLDNTIYPSSALINEGIDRRMIEAVSEFLSIDMETAAKMRSEKKKHYSSTLEWLMKERNLGDIGWYLRKVHPENEVEELCPVEGLKEFFASLKERAYGMAILTNGPAFHAQRVLDFYGISEFFSGIHGIEENHFHGKPYESAYRAALEKENFVLEETVFVDDYPKYVAGYMRLGGTAVLIDDEKKIADYEFPAFGKLYTLYSIFGLENILRYI